MALFAALFGPNMALAQRNTVAAILVIQMALCAGLL